MTVSMFVYKIGEQIEYLSKIHQKFFYFKIIPWKGIILSFVKERIHLCTNEIDALFLYKDILEECLLLQA